MRWVFALLIGLWAGSVAAQPRYVDVAAAAGIEFEHRNGARGQKQLPETMGSGVAFFDYDDDGWLDLYWVNVAAPAALYHNEGNGRFAERTQAAGVENSGCGMGAVAADYDNDGDADLYITCYGANILYRNQGDGRFADVTTTASVANSTRPQRATAAPSRSTRPLRRPM